MKPSAVLLIDLENFYLSREDYLEELKRLLEEVTDDDDHGNARVIRSVHRSDKIYSGNATALAPDLIVGYARGFRASWATCLGDITTNATPTRSARCCVCGASAGLQRRR